MKSGPQVVFRYSSTHEKEIPDGPFRHRMEFHRASPTCPQRIRTAQDPRSARDSQRHLLPAEERMSVASASSRLSQVAHRLLVLQEIADRWHLGEDQPGHPRTPARAPGIGTLGRAPEWWIPSRSRAARWEEKNAASTEERR